MTRLVKRFTGKSKVAEELSYMADVLNAIIKMSVEGGEFAIKPGVGAVLSLTKDDLIRIVKMTSDLEAADDGLLERTEGTAKLLQPGRNTAEHQDILEVIEGGEIDVHNRFGFSVSDGDITLLIRDLRTGEWWPVGGGGGGGYLTFRPTGEPCFGVGSICECVEAIVVDPGCNSGFNSGDVIEVWDRTGGDALSMPPQIMRNSLGLAMLVKDWLGESYEGFADEGGQIPVAACRWMAVKMFCTELQADYDGS